MAGLPAYHARTHAVGGTDPIDFPQLKTASFSSGLRSRSIAAGATTVIDFDTLWSNDSSFSYLDTHGSAPVRANFIEISEQGLYFVQGNVFSDDASFITSGFSGSDNPYIEIVVYYPSSASTNFLINSRSAAGWADGNSPIYGEMLTTTEYAHNSMVQTVWFNFDADWGESTLGIGVCLGCANAKTISAGGEVVITKMGDVLTSTTVA